MTYQPTNRRATGGGDAISKPSHLRGGEELKKSKLKTILQDIVLSDVLYVSGFIYPVIYLFNHISVGKKHTFYLAENMACQHSVDSSS